MKNEDDPNPPGSNSSEQILQDEVPEDEEEVSTDNEDDDDEYEPNHEEEDQSEEEDEDDGEDSTLSPTPKNELSSQEMKKRMEELWTQFQKDVSESKSKKNRPKETQPTTKTVIKHYDFAGERIDVEVTETISGKNSNNRITENGVGSPSSSSVASDSSSSNTTTDRYSSKRNGIAFLSGDPTKIGLSNGKRGMAGLTSVLNALQANKKERIGTIEKTKLDWQQYKRKEGIEEELKVQLRSKDGYLDKQEFLQRTDYRQFEIERDMRTKRRRLK